MGGIPVTTAERRKRIYDILCADKTVEVNDLSKRFEVSTMTIRRDLAIFEKQGIITTNYGGAYLNEGTAIEPSFAMKANLQLDSKRAMGAAAAALLENGDSIFLDCGTTTLRICDYMPNLKLQIMTNSLVACNMLKTFPKLKLIIMPGVYNDTSVGFLGAMTAEYIGRFNLDKAFIGTDGVDVAHGVTVPDETDAMVKAAILRSARQRILLAGQEKLGKAFMSKFAEMADIHILITDAAEDDERLTPIRAAGVKVMCVGQGGGQ
jgi:DeoR family fructose operon transcriptional repressor